MRKMISLFCIIIFVLGLAACGSEKVKIDYGKSEIYTQEDMDEAIALIIKKNFLHGRAANCTA